MKKLLTLTLAAAFMLATGCGPKNVAKTWEAAGGSRADATVEVGFTYNPQFEIPQHNENQALQEALKRCRAWGYADVEPFGMYKKTCQQSQLAPFGGVICTEMYVSRQYQCLGRGDSSTGNVNN